MLPIIMIGFGIGILAAVLGLSIGEWQWWLFVVPMDIILFFVWVEVVNK